MHWEDPLEEEMAIPSTILARKIPWTEEPGGIQSMGSQRVRHKQRLTLPRYLAWHVVEQDSLLTLPPLDFCNLHLGTSSDSIGPSFCLLFCPLSFSLYPSCMWQPILTFSRILYWSLSVVNIFLMWYTLVAQSCLILCDPMDCSPPGSSVHEIFQASILEWVAISFFRKECNVGLFKNVNWGEESRWWRIRTGRLLSLLQIHRKNNWTVNKVHKPTSDR